MKLKTLLIALALAVLVHAGIQHYNHPPQCDACHTYSTATSAGVTWLTSGTGSCDPSTTECVWNHQILTGTNVWLQCANCHSAIATQISNTPHGGIQGTYGCACHAVAHVGNGTATAGYTACIYYYTPNLGAVTGPYWGQSPPQTGLAPQKVCFYGTPGSTSYQISWSVSTPPSVTYIKAVALAVGYTKDQYGNVTIYPNQAQLITTDFFSLLTTGPFARYENYSRLSTGGGKISAPHALTDVAPGGETIIVGVFDIHEGAFILTSPWAKYGGYPYNVPVRKNPAFAACFNCHFIYKGQVGAAKIMEFGGVWKIGIPEDVFNSITDPHKIVLPASANAGVVAPNLAIVALLASAALFTGLFVIARRRLF